MLKSPTGWQTFQRQLSDLAREIVKDKPKLDFEAWAPRFMQGPNNTPFVWRPYQIAPARDLFFPYHPWVALRWYSGGGKTHLMGSAFVYAIHQLQLDIGLLYPNEKTSYRRLEEKIWPFFEQTPCVSSLALKTNLKGHKVWKDIGGSIEAVGANSSTALRVLEIAAAYADEVDSITQEESDEGDKVDQFLKRCRGLANVYKWLSSYPSMKDKSKIDGFMDLSDLCQWWVNCPRCSLEILMHTSQVVWPKDKPQRAEVQCPECAKTFSDSERRETSRETGKYRDSLGEIVHGGEKIRTGTGRGYHLNCMAHVGDHDLAFDSYLHEIAAEKLAIERTQKTNEKEKKRRVFLNTMDSESWVSPEEETVDPSNLYRQRENYNPNIILPREVLFITGGADCQKDRIEIEFVGWGAEGQTWSLDYVQIMGRTNLATTWKKVDAELLRRWKHPIVGDLRVSCTCMDSRYRPTHVRKFTSARAKRRIYAIKGATELGRPIIQRDKPTIEIIGGKQCKIYEVGTNEAKEEIYSSLDLIYDPKDGFPHGWMHYPQMPCYDRDYFKALTVERRRMKRARDGQMLPAFECPKGARNEPLDLRVYAMAAERILKPNYKAMQQFMDTQDGSNADSS